MALPWDDVQGNIYPGFKKPHQAFLFVRFPGTAPDLQARAWLDQLRLSIAASDEVQAFNALFKIVRSHRPGRESDAVRATWLNVGFTFPGLCKFGTLSTPVGTNSTPGFPREFADGMHNRADFIGDVASEQASWLIGGSDATLPDAVVVIAADVRADLDSEVEEQRQALAAHGLSEMALFDGRALGDSREHFGFVDNITDPEPVEAADVSTVLDRVLYTEFVLSPTRPAHVTDPIPPAWTENGSYMVFRRLYQDVAGFRAGAADAATMLNTGSGIPMNGPYFEAKCFGRWPDGTPVGTSPTPPTPGGSTDITAMDYLQDNVGTKIPRFSHVRKAHPRDLGLDSMGCPLPNRDTAKNHRLIRRGITYGTRLPAGSADDSCDRGLLFVGYQASLHEQFEFLAHHWLNLRSFPPLDPNVFPENPPGRAGSDPIVGASPNDPPSQRLVVYPTSVTTSGSIVSFTAQELLLDRYIKVRGGGYFFCPGISSLTALAGEPLSPARY